MKTRRKSKQIAAEAAAAEGMEVDASSQYTGDMDEPTASTSTSFSLPLPSDFPVERLNALFPGASLAAPTPDVILSVYKFVLDQTAELNQTTRALEESRADVVRKEVELDQALQDHEGLLNEQRSQMEELSRELAQVKLEKNELGTSPFYYFMSRAHQSRALL